MSNKQSVEAFPPVSKVHAKAKDQLNTSEKDHKNAQAYKEMGSEKKVGDTDKEENYQEDIQNYDFGDKGYEFQIFEEPRAVTGSMNRSPKKTMMLPPAVIGKRSREDFEDEDEDEDEVRSEDKENVGADGQGRRRVLFQIRGPGRSRYPLKDLYSANNGGNAARGSIQTFNPSDLLQEMTHLTYGLSAKEKQTEARRQKYLATIKANKCLAE